MRLLAAIAAAAVTLAAVPRASAYCRTTTTPIPPDYNPVVSGCLGGTALFWATMPVTYRIYGGASAQLPLVEATPIIDRSFAKWPAASCPSTASVRHPVLSVQNDGPTDASDPCADASAICDLSSTAVHGIYFRDDGWPYADSANEIALTTVTYGVEDGRIFSAVMEINSHDHVFSTEAPPPPGSISLEATVTHEAGHFVGMAHSQDTSAIMYAFYQSGAIALTDDDNAGVCAIYGSAPSSGGSCAVGWSSDASGLAWFGALGAAVVVLRRVRRTLTLLPRPGG